MKRSECENHIPGELGGKDSYVCIYCAKWVKKRTDTNSKNKEVDNKKESQT